jgi:hypothetical protein
MVVVESGAITNGLSCRALVVAEARGGVRE